MSETTENIPHRILFLRIPRDTSDLISLFLHFLHCSRYCNMSFHSLFCMHGYGHNRCFPFSARKVFGSVHLWILSWPLSWTLMPHTGSDSRKRQLLFSSGQSAFRKPCWTVCTAPELSGGRSGCRFCYKHLKQSPCMRGLYRYTWFLLLLIRLYRPTYCFRSR